MRSFLKSFFVFSGIVLGALLLGLVGSKWFVGSRFDFALPKGKNILVLGDSRTQCDVDDKVIPRAANLSESAETFFYSYVKAKALLAHNPQIDTLLLGYSFHNVAPNQDAWLVKPEINGYKLPLYFFMFDKQDVSDFVARTPRQFLRGVPSIIKTNASHGLNILRRADVMSSGIGGFKALHETIDYKKIPDYSGQFSSPKKYGTTDLAYLKKIAELCRERNVKLLLLNTPSHHTKEKFNAYYRDRYLEFYSDNLKSATLLDCSNFGSRDAYFADDSHLNAGGAKLFSEYLSRKLKPGVAP